MRNVARCTETTSWHRGHFGLNVLPFTPSRKESWVVQCGQGPNLAVGIRSPSQCGPAFRRTLGRFGGSHGCLGYGCLGHGCLGHGCLGRRCLGLNRRLRSCGCGLRSCGYGMWSQADGRDPALRDAGRLAHAIHRAPGSARSPRHDLHLHAIAERRERRQAVLGHEGDGAFAPVRSHDSARSNAEDEGVTRNARGRNPGERWKIWSAWVWHAPPRLRPWKERQPHGGQYPRGGEAALENAQLCL